MIITVDTTQARACAKCNTAKPPLFRHHKGSDGALGRYSKRILREYQQFLDCILLCFECHLTIHWLYERYWRDWVNRTPVGAYAMRAKLITVCDSWLHGQLKSPKVPKYYRKQFTESLETWQEQHAESKKPNSV